MSLVLEQIRDLELGVWIADGVYYFENGRRVWFNLPKTITNCMQNPLFFSHDDLSRAFPGIFTPDKKAYCEGRRCHITSLAPLEKFVISGDNQLALDVYEQLHKISGRWWSMSHLICGSIKDPIEDLINAECTEIGALISRSLIRTAATRIFNEPEQSIMELLVNSIDAYFPEKAVGKFGMGFFSILYWLVGKKSELSINSFCVDAQGRTYAYLVTIAYDSELVFKIEPIISYTNKTGTFIKLSFENEPSVAEFLKFRSYANRLAYVPDIDIQSSQDTNSKKYIHLSFHAKSIEVEDYATGITLDVLLTKLFIPSVSSKTIQASARASDKKLVQEAKATDFNTGCSIFVNDVAIKFIDSPNRFFWRLPSNTRLPVSRDDVFLEPISANETLGELIDLAVSRNVFMDLQVVLKTYMMTTSVKTNVSIIDTILNKKIKQYSNRLIPFNFGLKYFIPKGVWSLVFDLDYVREVLMYRLEANPKVTKLKSAFYGKKAYVIKDLPSHIKDLYFIDLLIVDEEIVHKPEWQVNLSLTYFAQGKLIPKSIAFENKVFLGDYEQELSKKAKIMITSISDLLIGIQSTKNARFDIDSEINNCCELYMVCGKYAYDVYNVLSQALKNFSPIKSYGDTKYTIFSNGKIKRNEFASKNEKFQSLLSRYIVDEIKTSTKGSSAYWSFTKLTFLPRKMHLQVLSHILERVDSYLYFDYLVRILRIANYNPDEIIPFFEIIYQKVKIRNPTLSDMMHINGYNIRYAVDHALITFTEKLYITRKIQIAPYIPVITFNTSTISNAKLINYLFDNQTKLTFDSFQQINFWTPVRDLKLQALEIAVNEGTTRPFIEAVLTECFQNSVDAIRKFDPPNKEVHFYFSLHKDHIVLTIEDFVGMPLESFLYISVPFLSTKNDKDPAYTGEMGTGFFNVYRESSKVLILTRPPDTNVTYVWEDIPIRRDGRVIDITKTFSTTQTLNSRGTRIEIHMPYSTLPQKDPMIKDFSHVADVSELITKLFCVTPLGVDVFFNKNKVTERPKFITTIGKFELYMSNIQHVSYLYTNGIPFAPIIYKEFVPEASTRMIVNILPGGYTPRQSRTHLDFGEHLKDYNSILDTAVQYAAMSDTINRTNQYTFDPSFLDTSDVSSVLPNRNYEGWAKPRTLNYRFLGFESIAESLHKAAEACNYDPSISENKKRLEAWLEKTYPRRHDELSVLTKRYVSEWFRTKDAGINIVGVIEETAQGTNELSLALLTIIYVELARKLKIYGFESEVKAMSLPGYGRSFALDTTIYIYGASSFGVKQAFAKKVEYYSTLNRGEWFDLYKPVGTFTHEMEHVRRNHNTKEGDGQHDVIRTPLWEGDEAKERSFVECQLEIYLKIVEAGLWRIFDERYAKIISTR